VLGTDVLCQAKSGKGKTAVFVLSILQQLEAASSGYTAPPKAEPPKCVVLCHTRYEKRRERVREEERREERREKRREEEKKERRRHR
jgi:hypothetical protein